MKKLLFTTCMCMASASYAQFKIPTIAAPRLTEKKVPTIKPELDRVARDFFQNFENLKGDTLVSESNTVLFASKVVPAGATDCFITQYAYPNSYSWQATLFVTESYEEAVSRYRAYYRQLAGAQISFHDKTTYRLRGQYDTPDEGRSFASSLLELEEAPKNLRPFKIEIALKYSFPEWSVLSYVYQRISDEEVRPTVERDIY